MRGSMTVERPGAPGTYLARELRPLVDLTVHCQPPARLFVSFSFREPRKAGFLASSMTRRRKSSVTVQPTIRIVNLPLGGKHRHRVLRAAKLYQRRRTGSKDLLRKASSGS